MHFLCFFLKKSLTLYWSVFITILTERAIAERPREVNSWRAAALLYGDLGTSKAYVLGLAFAFAAYSSFWYILAVSILTLLVGLNYIEICKLYPDGGGVYTSARNHSKVLALIGAFFIISDYLITAALSSVSAFHYLGVPNPEYWAMLAIAVIGLFNFVGPKHSGNLAIALAIPTFISIICLGAFSLPFLPQAIQNLTPISNNFFADWNIFASIVVALSGIESIANTTGSMKLNKDCTTANPCVSKTATIAILMVIAEVCIFTSLLGLAMNALPGLEVSGGDVSAPDFPNVRDAMLRYMADTFSGNIFGAIFGHLFSMTISIVIMLLLLSAVNTAIVALISILFIMSRDGEMPVAFQKLNRFGVPIFPTLISFLFPICVLLFVSDILGLASLYAIGFVGAIAVNLVATSTNNELDLKPWKRVFMFGTFIIMLLIEITLFVDKPHARTFVLSMLGVGLLTRALVQERKEAVIAKNGFHAPEITTPTIFENAGQASLIALTGMNKSMDFAIEDAKKNQHPLYILFIREQRFVTKEDQTRSWQTDEDASQLFKYVLSLNLKIPIEFLYLVTADIAHNIVKIAKLKNINKIIIGRKRKFSLLSFFRGSTVNELLKVAPKEIDILVVYD